MMSTVLPYLLSGISVGGQYALIAIGYTMVYGILRLINFAHGDVFMVAGILMVYISASGLPLYVCIPLVLILTAVIGFTIERVAYKPLRTAPRMSIMISAIGVSYTLQNLSNQGDALARAAIRENQKASAGDETQPAEENPPAAGRGTAGRPKRFYPVKS